MFFYEVSVKTLFVRRTDFIFLTKCLIVVIWVRKGDEHLTTVLIHIFLNTLQRLQVKTQAHTCVSFFLNKK